MKNATDQLVELGYRIEDEKFRANHMFGVRLPKSVDVETLKQSLHQNRVSVSIRGDAVRLAPNVYNDEMDGRKLLKAMKEPIFASKH